MLSFSLFGVRGSQARKFALIIISIALASFALVPMANPRTTKFASFEVPGQQHSTIKSWQYGRNGEGMRGQAKDTRPGQETHCAGGCSVEGCGVTLGTPTQTCMND